MEIPRGEDPPPPPNLPSDFPPLGSCAATADAGSGDAKGAWRGDQTLAQLLSRTLRPAAIPVQVHAPAATDLGKPAAFFSSEEVHVSCNPLDYVLMVKTPLGRPPFQIIRGHLSQRFKLAKDFILCPYDGRHILLRMGSREDFLKLLLKGTTYVDGKPFHFQKWSMEFSVAADSPLVPVWLEMPRLPANFFLEPMLRSIAGSIGQVLKIAQCTLDMTMAHAAIVCVQLDVSQPLPDCVWIGIGAGGFWQPLVYPNPPQFCNSCSRLGHLSPSCRQGGTSGAPPHKGTNAASDKDAMGPERQQKQPHVNVHWRPVVAQPAAAKPIPPVKQGTNIAHEVFDAMSQHESPSGSRASIAQAQFHGVYLTPPKRPQQKSALCTPAKGSDQVASSEGEPAPQQVGSQPSLLQVAASQVLDEMTQSLDHLSLEAKAPGSNVGGSGGSPQLNPAAPAWSPPIQGRGDIDMSDESPPIPSAAREEHIQRSDRGKEPELPTDRIVLPTTFDVMNFPGIPELPEHVPPKIHARARPPPSASQEGGAAQPVLGSPTHQVTSRLAAKGSNEAKMPEQIPSTPDTSEPHTELLGCASVRGSPPHQVAAAGPSAGRLSFKTAIRRKLRSSDTRRTERALEEGSDLSISESSSEEDDPPDPPPPPPLVSDWVQAAAPGKLIIGLPASQKGGELPKKPEKEGEEPKLPARQTRQTLRRGFL